MNGIRNGWFSPLFAFGILLALGLAGCELDEADFRARTDDTYPDPGPEFRLASIGNSLTAGFQNGGIRQDGQQASFPNLLAQTMTDTEMYLPLVGDPGIGSETGLSPLFVDLSSGSPSITRKPLTVGPQQLALNLSYPLPYDNLGVPGATTHQMLNTIWGDPVNDPGWTEGRDADNALFNLILRNVALPLGGSVVRQWENRPSQIVTIWTGNNEILGGSLSGEPQVGVNREAGDNILPVSLFQSHLTEMFDRIEAMQPQMVAVGNVPPITAIPFVRLWGISPPTVFPPGSVRWNMAEDKDGTVDPQTGIDEDPVQLVLQTAPVSSCLECYDPRTCGGANPCKDIPEEFTLTVSEVDLINDTIDAYNAFIAAEVAARGWAAADINAAFLAIPTSPVAGPLNTAFPVGVSTGSVNTNSAFTLDGIHPSEKGHGEVANRFLEAINATYGTSYPLYDLNDFRNVAGLEQLLSAGKSDLGPLTFTEEGRAGLLETVEMMKARF